MSQDVLRDDRAKLTRGKMIVFRWCVTALALQTLGAWVVCATVVDEGSCDADGLHCGRVSERVVAERQYEASSNDAEIEASTGKSQNSDNLKMSLDESRSALGEDEADNSDDVAKSPDQGDDHADDQESDEEEDDEGGDSEDEVEEADDQDMSYLAAMTLDVKTHNLKHLSVRSTLRVALANSKTEDDDGVSTRLIGDVIVPGTDDIIVVCSGDDDRGADSDGAPATVGYVTAMSCEDGAERWTTTLPSAVVATPAHSVDRQLLFVGTVGWVVYALSVADGDVAWQFAGSNAAFAASPVVGVRALLFVANVRGLVYALDSRTGRLVWSRDVGPGSVLAQPVPTVLLDAPVVLVGLVRDKENACAAEDNEGNANTATMSDNIFALHALTGEVVLARAVAGDVVRSPIVSPSKRLVVTALQTGGESVVSMLDPKQRRATSPVWSRTVCKRAGEGTGAARGRWDHASAHALIDTNLNDMLVLCPDGVGFGLVVEDGVVETRTNLSRLLGAPVAFLAAPVLRNDMMFFTAATNGIVFQLGIATGRTAALLLLGQPIVAAPVLGPYGYLFCVGHDGLVVAHEVSDAALTWRRTVRGRVRASPVLL